MSRPGELGKARRKFHGVLQILRYNVHYYVGGHIALLAVATLLWFQLLPRLMQVALGGMAGLAAFWSLSSLAASYYIYD